MKVPAIIVFLGIVLMTTSCKFNSTYTNREEDREEAEKVMNDFYALMKTRSFTQALPLFSEKMFAITDSVKLMEIFHITQKKLGDLQLVSQESWETQIVVGTNPSSTYKFIYVNTYSTGQQAEETINLVKDDDGVIRIYGYHLTSDAFLDV